MRIHVNDPGLVPDLLRYLQQRPDAIIARVGETQLEVSILGSRRQAYNRLELDLRLRAWRAAHPDAEVDVR